MPLSARWALSIATASASLTAEAAAGASSVAASTTARTPGHRRAVRLQTVSTRRSIAARDGRSSVRPAAFI